MMNRLKSKLSTDANLKELLTGSAITFVLKIGGMGLAYVVIYLISRKTGSEGVGYYSVINQSLMLLGLIGTWGTGVSVLRYVGQFNNEEDRSQLGPLYKNILTIVLPASVLLGALTFFLAPFIAEFVFHDVSYSPALRWVGIVLPFFGINSVGIEFLRGLQQLKASEFIRSVTRPIIMISGLLVFWNNSLSYLHIIYLLLVALLVNTCLSSTLIWSNLRTIPKAISSRIQSTEILRVSSPMLLSGLTAALMSSLPLFYLSYFHSMAEVGVFSIAFRISLFISIVLTVVNTIAAPKFSSLFWAKKHQELQRVIDQSTQLMFWGALFLSALIVFAAPTILSAFGDDFGEGYLPLIVLVIGQFINAATGSVGLFLNMSGNQKILRNTALISLGVHLILAWALVPAFGILGAAITATSAGILWNLLCILFVHFKLNIRTYYVPFIKS